MSDPSVRSPAVSRLLRPFAAFHTILILTQARWVESITP